MTESSSWWPGSRSNSNSKSKSNSNSRSGGQGHGHSHNHGQQETISVTVNVQQQATVKAQVFLNSTDNQLQTIKRYLSLVADKARKSVLADENTRMIAVTSLYGAEVKCLQQFGAQRNTSMDFAIKIAYQKVLEFEQQMQDTYGDHPRRAAIAKRMQPWVNIMYAALEKSGLPRLRVPKLSAQEFAAGAQRNYGKVINQTNHVRPQKVAKISKNWKFHAKKQKAQGSNARNIRMNRAQAMDMDHDFYHDLQTDNNGTAGNNNNTQLVYCPTPQEQQQIMNEERSRAEQQALDRALYGGKQVMDQDTKW